MAATAGSDVSDGPVLNLINKRLRALRKKLNRISQMEDSISQGKTLNKEQEEVFRTKSSAISAIDELEKLKQPLAIAVSEEIDLAIKVKSELVSDKSEVVSDVKGELVSDEGGKSGEDFSVIEKLLEVLYFGSMFDVRSEVDFTRSVLTKTHERNCCLSYDYVSDDESELLAEKDLDLISKVGSLLVSRPVDTSLSHKNALEKCVERAKLWIESSEQPIEGESNVTYSLLKEKLAKIMASPYFTTLPEMKAPVEVVAAAGNFGSFQAQVDVQYQQKDDEVANTEGNESSDNQAGPVDKSQNGENKVENSTELPAHSESVKPQPDREQTFGDVEAKEQQYNRRQFQNQRGGRGAGGRRGYSNGRGGRNGNSWGGGPYQNGRNQYYDQPGNYYPRNNYYSNRGRGGGRGAAGNNHGSAVPTES
ncbi:Glycine-rich protein [Heracleum sosnowskyi]|uniref:Glycine-rich protein n=1 Tax=Heracleum sosnowskyi TaxID=360622 RepID=A0AAD8I2Q7_9APIA|nr:Glycine-rich protein [Heracleum sosnowskyi]